MKIIPAIDLINNKCVRLIKGDYKQMTVYSDDPVYMAQKLEEDGADILHVVDLEGAKLGRPVHTDLIRQIQKKLSIPVEVGGGIRTEDSIKLLLDIGVERIILGTVVTEDKQFAQEVLIKYNDFIIFGMDARGDKLAIKGWIENTDIDIISTINEYEKIGLKHIIYTDIDRDGVMKGPNLGMLQKILQKTKVELIASGGISSPADIMDLINFTKKEEVDRSLFGCIIGKAIYEGKVSLKEAKVMVGKRES